MLYWAVKYGGLVYLALIFPQNQEDFLPCLPGRDFFACDLTLRQGTQSNLYLTIQ